MKYSVIVPIYNAEKTLPRCIDSIIQQEHPSMELLLINDGSSDGSETVCRAYQEKYGNIRYYYQKNSGVSAARNRGLAEAQGEYIIFVDSDDYISMDYLSAADAALEEKNADLLLFGKEYTTGEPANADFPESMNAETGTVYQKITQLFMTQQLNALPARVFRGEIIRSHRLQFQKGLSVGEDSLFVFRYALFVQSLRVKNHPVYYIDVSNSGSLTRRPRPYLCEQFLTIHRSMIDQLRSSSWPEREKQELQAAVIWSYYRSAYSTCKDLRKNDWSARRRRAEIRNVCIKYTNAGIKPSGWKCWLIAIPVRMNIAFMIDLLISVH